MIFLLITTSIIWYGVAVYEGICGNIFKMGCYMILCIASLLLIHVFIKTRR